MLPRVYLARHGETEWTLSGQHTGRTDIPLTARGEADARHLGDRIKGHAFALVLTSPLQRARRTCELAGLGDRCQVDEDLREWDYGEFEGLKTAEIRQRKPDWNLFRDGCPGGENAEQVGARADRLIEKLRRGTREAGRAGDAIVFSHGHMLRVLTARWVGLPASGGRLFLCDPASLGVLGYEHDHRDEPVVRLWNDVTG